jgi:costal 2
VQCFNIDQLLEALSVGLSNRNTNNNHNILSIVLEQQWINQPQHKLSTVNFCDLNYTTDRATISNFCEPMNFYSAPPYAYSMPSQNGNYFSPPPATTDQFTFNGLQLAQLQSNKLLKNAEILFSKLNLNDMNETQRKEIQEWMSLKNECDNFIPAPELPPSYAPMPPQPSSLLPIIEMDETNDPDEDETNENDDSDSGSYIDINDQSNNLFAKISDKMENFREKTDELVKAKNGEYFQNNPKVLSSGQSDAKPDEAAGGVDLKTSMSEQQYLAKSGRRKSIRDNNILNSDELTLIRKAAAATSLDNEIVKESVENEQLTKLDEMRKVLKKSMASIDATALQIKEVEQTIALKKNLITDLIENSKTGMTVKSNCSKKKTKYQSDYEKAKKELSRAMLAGKSAKEIQRLKDVTAKFEEKLKSLTTVNQIAVETLSNQKVKQLHKSLEQSKKQLEILSKVMKKEIKHKESIEKDITKQLKLIEGENSDNLKLAAASPSPSSATGSKISDSKVKIRDVNARISHLDEILKEKSSNLQLFGVAGSPGEDRDGKEKESLRYEIRNLRRTRDTLLDQRVSLYKKLKRDKMLTYKEERKMLECDEAIMVRVGEA